MLDEYLIVQHLIFCKGKESTKIKESTASKLDCQLIGCNILSVV